MLLTAETYSKFIHPRDKSVRTIFGDAAAATLITAKESEMPFVGPFVYGTDGAGAENLIVKTGGMRAPRTEASGIAAEAESGNIRSADSLFMNGGEIFTFTVVFRARCRDRLLSKSGIRLDQVDLFVFHQANAYMLEHLRKRMKIARRQIRCSHGALRQYGVFYHSDCAARFVEQRPVEKRRDGDAGGLWCRLFMGRHTAALGVKSLGQPCGTGTGISGCDFAVFVRKK